MPQHVLNLSPHCDLPDLQFNARARPCYRLLWAVLERTVKDALRVSGRISNREHKEAHEYLLSDSTEPWSYFWVCEHLDVDPLVVLDRLVKKILASPEEA